MDATRLIEGLGVYYLLAIIAPGVTLCLAFASLVSPLSFSASSVGYTNLVFVGFVVGGLLQPFAARATGSRKDFRRTLDTRTGQLEGLEILEMPPNLEHSRLAELLPLSRSQTCVGCLSTISKLAGLVRRTPTLARGSCSYKKARSSR